ncbi:MAG: hypothetical protein GY845_09680 [Planctomycetes bacterium]|nr:hypothetical protein [Planctomycetota bacterium]
MMAQHQFNTEELSPAKPFCHRCGHLLDDSTAYCTNCGKIHKVIASTINAHQRCPIHSQPMINVCSMCGRPVCKTCYEGEVTLQSPYKCTQCLQKCEEIESSYRMNLEKTGKCAKHPNRTRIGKCKACGYPVCEFCGYLWLEGRIFRNIIDGPYCTSCNTACLVSPGSENKNKFTSILFQLAVSKQMNIPASVFDISLPALKHSTQDEVTDTTVYDCPVCGKVVRANSPKCLYCAEQLLWLEGIPYRNAKYPAQADRLHRSASTISECPLCGDMIKSDWDTCPHCGEKLCETV